MIIADYHTHTPYSHGKGTVLQNATEAAAKGLKEIAISDHSFNHRTFGIKAKDLPRVREDCLKATESTGIKVLLGLETNLLDAKGNIDIGENPEQIDIIICGYHKLVKRGARAIFGFSVPIMMAGLLHKSTAKRIAANTDAFINAMDKYPIDIISHPNTGLKTDVRQLARAAAHHGVYLELNGKRIGLSIEDAQIILEEGASFIVNSDAHSSARVGDFSLPLEFAERAKIPKERIANWDRLPDFRSRNSL